MNVQYPAKILLVDDHALIRKGIAALLQKYNDTWELYEAENGIQGVLKAREIRPDIILMDYIMPKLDGLKAAAIIKQELPETEIIIVTMDMRPEIMLESIDAGISRIVPKQAPESELLTAISDIGKGKTDRRKSARRTKKSHTRHKLLTDREIEVLNFLALGMHLPEIASRLVVSKKTVDNHKMNIFRKCRVHSIPELMRFALRNRIIEF